MDKLILVMLRPQMTPSTKLTYVKVWSIPVSCCQPWLPPFPHHYPRRVSQRESYPSFNPGLAPSNPDLNIQIHGRPRRPSTTLVGLVSLSTAKLRIVVVTHPRYDATARTTNTTLEEETISRRKTSCVLWSIRFENPFQFLKTGVTSSNSESSLTMGT